ncbi:MAG: hypothetical protein U0M13_11455, partial [Desulfovibrio fairfieldensis]|nr:hypothetical protein [Desulfovibrio fairfieldensis]
MRILRGIKKNIPLCSVQLHILRGKNIACCGSNIVTGRDFYIFSTQGGSDLGNRGFFLPFGRGTEAQRAHGGLGVAEIGAVLCRGDVDVAAGGH